MSGQSICLWVAACTSAVTLAPLTKASWRLSQFILSFFSNAGGANDCVTNKQCGGEIQLRYCYWTRNIWKERFARVRHRYVSNCFLAKNDIERPRKTKRPRNRFKKIGPRHVLHKRNPHCCDTIEDLRNEYGLKGLRHELKQKKSRKWNCTPALSRKRC